MYERRFPIPNSTEEIVDLTQLMHERHRSQIHANSAQDGVGGHNMRRHNNYHRSSNPGTSQDAAQGCGALEEPRERGVAVHSHAMFKRNIEFGLINFIET